MRKILVFSFISVFAFIFSFNVVLANGDHDHVEVSLPDDNEIVQEEDLPDPGLSPDSPFYFLDIWGEAVGTFFTVGNEAKAKRLSQLADERLAEVRDVIRRKREDKAERAIKRYERHLAAIEEKIKSKELERNEKIQDRIAEATATHQAVLEGVLEQVPEEATTAVSMALERSMRGHQESLKRLAELNDRRAGEIAAKAVRKRLEEMKKLRDAGIIFRHPSEATERFKEYEEFAEEFERTKDGFRTRFRTKLSESLQVAYELESEDGFGGEAISGGDAEVEIINEFRETAREFRQKYKERFRKLAEESPEDAAEAYEEILDEVGDVIEEVREHRERAREAALEDLEEFRETSQDLVEEMRRRSGSEEGEKVDHGKVLDRIEKAQDRHIDRLKVVSEQVPEEAQDAIEQAIKRQEENRELMLERLRDALERQKKFREEILKRQEEFREKSLKKREEIRDQFKDRGDKTEEERRRFREEFEENGDISDFKKKIERFRQTTPSREENQEIDDEQNSGNGAIDKLLDGNTR